MFLSRAVTIGDVGFWAVIVGGLGLFLFGITYLSSTLKEVAGPKLKQIISKAAGNRFKGTLVGMLFTAIIQSSGGTSALAVGLVRAGVMSLPISLSIIIGAKVGTTITAFLISIPFGEYMPFILFIGAFIVMLASKRRLKNVGKILFALGAIFFGIFLMQTFLSVLAKEQWMTDMFTFLGSQPWLGLLVGILVTAIFQSSSAVIGIMQGLYAAAIIAAGQQSIPLSMTLYGVLPIVFGANIGANAPAILASIGGNADSKRAALGGTITSTIGALLFMVILVTCKPMIDGIEQTFVLNGLNAETAEAHAATSKVVVAMCHLVFNVTITAIAIPLLTPLTNLTKLIIRDKKTNETTQIKELKELDKKIIKKFPLQGIALAHDLSLDMFKYVDGQFKCLKDYISVQDQDTAEHVLQLEGAIDQIDRHLNDFLLSCETGTLNKIALKNYSTILRGTKDIERIGDYAENLINFYVQIHEKREVLTEEMIKELSYANDKAIELIEKTTDIYNHNDKELALVVIQARRDYIKVLEDYQNKHFERAIKQSGKQASYTSLIYVDILNCYERVYSHCSNIAKLFNSDKDYTTYSTEEEHKFQNMANRY